MTNPKSIFGNLLGWVSLEWKMPYSIISYKHGVHKLIIVMLDMWINILDWDCAIKLNLNRFIYVCWFLALKIMSHLLCTLIGEVVFNGDFNKWLGVYKPF